MTPDFLQKIRSVSEDVKDGWASEQKMMALAGAVFAFRPKVCVEIGVWSGRSFFPVALALNETKSGVAIGIDPWSCEASASGMEGEHKSWWGTVDHDKIHDEFMARLETLGLVEVARIFRCKSSATTITQSIDLLHIDGNHCESDSIADVQNYATQVRGGGLLFMDDIEWAPKAYAMLPSMGFVELYKMDSGAMLQKL